MADSERTWTIAGLSDAVAQPHRYAGGGAVAAMSLAGAAATAELVFQLSRRRRNLSQEQQERLDRAVEQLRSARSAFLQAIDDDMASLTELMDAQQHLRKARKAQDPAAEAAGRDRMQRALDSAIATPLGVAREAAGLLTVIGDLHTFARPFTASDLGAAAATIQGAITSLLLMVEVNLGMVDAAEEAEQIRQEIDELSNSSATRAQEVVASTRRMINEDRNQGT